MKQIHLKIKVPEYISSHNITSETVHAAKECVSVYTFHHLEMMDHVNERTFFGNVTTVRFAMMKRGAESFFHTTQSTFRWVTHGHRPSTPSTFPLHLISLHWNPIQCGLEYICLKFSADAKSRRGKTSCIYATDDDTGTCWRITGGSIIAEMETK